MRLLLLVFHSGGYFIPVLEVTSESSRSVAKFFADLGTVFPAGLIKVQARQNQACTLGEIGKEDLGDPDAVCIDCIAVNNRIGCHLARIGQVVPITLPQDPLVGNHDAAAA